jgi:predicted esterase
MTNAHLNQPVFGAGASLAEAKAAMIMIHGRGATAQDILSLAGELAIPEFTYLAPQAYGNTWYPQRFMQPLASNEPWLSSALDTIGALQDTLIQQGIPRERIMLLGFSQGACLALEYAARHATRYGGVVALSGSLIGPDDMLRNDQGSLAGTPVFLGCSDVDFHIPLHRVQASTAVMRTLGGTVTERIYEGMDHTVNADELTFVREMMASVIPTP